MGGSLISTIPNGPFSKCTCEPCTPPGQGAFAGRSFQPDESTEIVLIFLLSLVPQPLSGLFRHRAKPCKKSLFDVRRLLKTQNKEVPVIDFFVATGRVASLITNQETP